MDATLIVIAACGGALVLFLFSTFRYIPNDRVGIVERRWSPHGSVPSGLIALHDEAGYQPQVLRGGWHIYLPFIYRIHRVPLVTISQGRIGYVFARDGLNLPATQSMASNVTTADFSDVRAFLAKDGEKGPQRAILREGTYAINLAQFVVLTPERTYFLPMDPRDAAMFEGMSELIAKRQGFAPVVIKGDEDAIGIVTVHDGPSLSSGEIIAPTVGADPHESTTFHNNFQDADRFLAAGGSRGRQLQVLVEGTWYINRLFATVELVKKTFVEVGTVGVVVSYTGEAGVDISGADYRHGELVAPGKRGVWSEPLLPGKYAFNTYAGRIVIVPTTNFILKWNKTEVGAHRLDENLSEVSLITKDAFEPTLPLSVVVHIDYRKAPLVVQRFGDVKRLVEQTLDPMVSAYFKNTGQTRTLIELIHERSEIQRVSAEEMKAKFNLYNLELQEVLIGTPGSGPTSQGGQQIEEILKQLRSRQMAAEQIETYTRQQRASEKERELREAEARARQQQMLTESELEITVQSNQGKADLARAQQEAGRIQTLAAAEASRTRLLAEGDAQKIRLLAESEADRVARVGVAQALAIEEQVRAYGGPQYQLIQEVMNRFAQAIEAAKVDVVPRIQMGGAGQGGGGLVENLLGVLMSQRLATMVEGKPDDTPRDPSAQALRDELVRSVSAP